MFYEFNQNNSGGGFDFNRSAGITHIVIIEADSAGDANKRAESIGLYFDGDGDCPCCGDRWYSAYGDGDEVPAVYGTPVEDYHIDYKWMGTDPEIFIHYTDGRIVGSNGAPKLISVSKESK